MQFQKALEISSHTEKIHTCIEISEFVALLSLVEPILLSCKFIGGDAKAELVHANYKVFEELETFLHQFVLLVVEPETCRT